MRPEQWEIFKKAARLERLDNIPMALIIDSPWIPGYVGVNHMDFIAFPLTGGDSGGNCDPPFLLISHPVHHGFTVMNLTYFMGTTGVK